MLLKVGIELGSPGPKPNAPSTKPSFLLLMLHIIISSRGSWCLLRANREKKVELTYLFGVWQVEVMHDCDEFVLRFREARIVLFLFTDGGPWLPCVVVGRVYFKLIRKAKYLRMHRVIEGASVTW